MAHQHHADVLAQVAKTAWLPAPDLVAGLTLGSLTDVRVSQNGMWVSDPVADLGLALVEVDAVNAPGLYYVSIVPAAAGTLFVSFTYLAQRYEYTLSVQEPAFSDAGLEGDYTATITDGTDPVQGARVTVYDAAGTALVTRGVTDANGEVTFYGLPVGVYQLRAFKDGIDFSGINPTLVTVVASDAAAPILEEALPSTFSIGDWLVILGRLFDPADTQVVFGAEATVAPSHVNAAGTAVLVQVPGGLTNTVIPLQVAKASGTVLSNILTVVRT